MNTLTSKVAITLFSVFALTFHSYGQETKLIKDNATGLGVTRDWALLQTDIAPNSFGAPVISRVGGSGACVDNTADIQTQATFSISVPGLNNPVYTWSTVGDLELVQFTGNQATVRFKKRSVTGANKPGKLVVNYEGTTSTEVTVPYSYQDCCPVDGVEVCETTSGTTTYIDVDEHAGQASVNLVQKFAHTYEIVGPTCINDGETVTYSIAPLVSSYDAQDGYKWEQVRSDDKGFDLVTSSAYTSLDNSSITVLVKSVPTSLSVYVGACNQSEGDKKTFTFGKKMDKPVAEINGYAKNPCLDGGISQITLNVLTPNVTDVDYKWISDIPNTTVVSGSLTDTTVTLNIGGNPGQIYLQASPKKGSSAFCSESGPIYDTITIKRGYTDAEITGIDGSTAVTCLEIGKTYQYAATKDGAAIGVGVNWTLPAGLVFEPSGITQTTSTITVKLTSALASGSQITGSMISTPGVCGGNINGIYDLKTAPSFTAITGANPSGTAGVFCVTPGAYEMYTATAANYENFTWTSTGGITGSGGDVFHANISNPFTSGTITGIAKKSGCPDTDPVTITLKSNTNLSLSGISSSKTCYNKGIADEVILTTDAGYSSYTWTVPAGWTIQSGQGTNAATITTNGTTGTVSVTAQGDCGTTAAKSITLTAEGIGENVTITKTSVPGADILSTGNYPGATYQWFKNGSVIPIPGATGFSLLLPESGVTSNTYCVVLTRNSCKTGGVCENSTYVNARMGQPTESFGEAIYSSPAGINAFPNPVDNKLTVSIESSSKSKSVINVYQQGTGVKIETAKTSNAYHTFNTSNWINGIYVIEIITDNVRRTTSVVVAH